MRYFLPDYTFTSIIIKALFFRNEDLVPAL